MSQADDTFSTAIAGIEGRWPAPPAWFSYSSYSDATECPRRWALTRATYPSLWGRPGYPDRPHVAAVVGDIVHRALEQIVRALVEAGSDSSASSAAVAVLRSLGGYSAVVDQALAERIRLLDGNPRMRPRVQAFVREVRNQLPEMRQRTQGALSRTTLIAGTARTEGETGSGPPSGDGSYPELKLVSTALGWAGRADLVTIVGSEVEIVDYKTGAPAAHHADQLRTYALLWSRQDQADPTRPYATKLTLSYPTHDEQVPVPSSEELNSLETELVARSAELRDRLATDRRPQPAPETCRFCTVRHLCDSYWRTVAVVADGWTDAELTIDGRNGPRSFRAHINVSGEDVLVRASEQEDWPAGSQWRIISAYGARPDDDMLTLSLTTSSEAYRMKPQDAG